MARPSLDVSVPVLVTERLRLGPWRQSDIDSVATFVSQDGSDRAASLLPLELRAIAHQWRSSGFGYWSIRDRATDAFVGFVAFTQDGNLPHPEISWLIRPELRGRGYAAEAASAAVDFGFGTLGFHALIGTCFPGNTSSLKVMEKLGMRFAHGEGTEGSPVVAVAQLERDQWAQQRG